MWTVRQESLTGNIIAYNVLSGENSVARQDVFHLWQHDDEFRAFFINVLATCPFDAFRWETPPVTRDHVSRPFEFVLVNSPSLSAQASPDAFAEYFNNDAAKNIVSFYNLGKDALLIVPCPVSATKHYAHLAAFVRNAPDHQQHELWRTTGIQMENRINDKPVWLSTAGAGVPWLHIRLDDRPKYYAHKTYRNTD